MRRKTTSTRNLCDIFTNDIAEITLAELRYKVFSDSSTMEYIHPQRFLDSLMALNKESLFDCVGWQYEKNLAQPDEYIIYSDLHDPYAGTYCIAHLKTKPEKSDKEVENILRKTIFNKIS